MFLPVAEINIDTHLNRELDCVEYHPGSEMIGKCMFSVQATITYYS